MTMRLVPPEECAHPVEEPRLLLALTPGRAEVSMVEVVFCPDCRTWLTWDQWFIAGGDDPADVYAYDPDAEDGAPPEDGADMFGEDEDEDEDED
jgi:hypothetical protein